MGLERYRIYVTIRINQNTRCVVIRVITRIPGTCNTQAQLVCQKILYIQSYHRVGMRYVAQRSLLKECQLWEGSESCHERHGRRVVIVQKELAFNSDIIEQPAGHGGKIRVCSDAYPLP